MTKAKKDKGADKAYLKAVEEIEKDRVNEVKVVVKQVLEGIVSAQKQEREAKEKLAFLNFKESMVLQPTLFRLQWHY